MESQSELSGYNAKLVILKLPQTGRHGAWGLREDSGVRLAVEIAAKATLRIIGTLMIKSGPVVFRILSDTKYILVRFWRCKVLKQ